MNDTGNGGSLDPHVNNNGRSNKIHVSPTPTSPGPRQKGLRSPAAAISGGSAHAHDFEAPKRLDTVNGSSRRRGVCLRISERIEYNRKMPSRRTGSDPLPRNEKLRLREWGRYHRRIFAVSVQDLTLGSGFSNNWSDNSLDGFPQRVRDLLHHRRRRLRRLPPNQRERFAM